VSTTIDRRRPEGYLAEMRYAYGERGAEIARAVIDRRLRPPFYRMPLCERVVDSALAVAAHSDFALRYVLAVRDVPVQRLSQPVPSPAAAPAPEGKPADEFRIGTFGDVVEHKRLHVALRALELLRPRLKRPLRLIVAGALHDYYDFRTLAAHSGVADVVDVRGRVPEAQFDALMLSCDVALSLRHPTAGETSAAALRQMSLGIPTVISDAGAMREIPDGACLKLAPRDGEAEELADLLQLLAEQPQVGARIAEGGRRLALAAHQPGHTADQLLQLVARLWDDREVLAPLRRPAAPLADVPSEMLADDIGVALTDLGLRVGEELADELLHGVAADALSLGLARV
jgi:glycosyltransferase involved in cell wall biosynthesis